MIAHLSTFGEPSMNPNIFSVFALAIITSCGGGDSGKSRPTEANFVVTVSPMDSSGGKWDKYDGEGHPDIGLCVETELGKRCYPDDRLLKSQCPDTNECTFSNIAIPPTPFTVRVVDVDALNNETVGEAECDWGETCTVGQAKVKIR
jgi:hypothetical protein